MLELDFEGLKIQSNPREIWVHPAGHAEKDWDYRAGVLLSWQDNKVVLQTIRFFSDTGCYVSATLMKFHDRPFPESKEDAIQVVKGAIRTFAEQLVASLEAPCRYCGGLIAEARCGSCGEADGV